MLRWHHALRAPSIWQIQTSRGLLIHRALPKCLTQLNTPYSSAFAQRQLPPGFSDTHDGQDRPRLSKQVERTQTQISVFLEWIACVTAATALCQNVRLSQRSSYSSSLKASDKRYEIGQQRMLQAPASSLHEVGKWGEWSVCVCVCLQL